MLVITITMITIMTICPSDYQFSDLFSTKSKKTLQNININFTSNLNPFPTPNKNALIFS